MPNDPSIHRRRSQLLLSLIALGLAVGFAPSRIHANGGDLPPKITLQGFIKPDDGRLEFLIRIPLVLLASFNLPKRGPGYLDLAQIDDRLAEAAAATARQIELFEDGVQLSPAESRTRLALLSDRSFDDYARALAHMQAPKLPIDTDLYWNQGFLDAEIAYPIKSPRANFSVRVNVAPEMGQRVQLHLGYLVPGGAVRTYDLAGWSWRVPLDPRWYQSAKAFLWTGFTNAFALDRLLFVACLVAPFRRFSSLLVVVMALTGLQALSLSASALGAAPDWRVLDPIVDICLATAILLVAIENVIAPSLRRRWFAASVVGVLSGFSVGHGLTEAWQFVGAHAVVSTVSFNVGVAVGEIVLLGLLYAALGVLFRYVTGPRAGVVVLSALLGHAACHWMLESGHRVEHAIGGLSAPLLGAFAWWLAAGIFVGGVARLLPAHFGGSPIPPPFAPAPREASAKTH